MVQLPTVAPQVLAKQPDENCNFSMDFTAWLNSTETISTISLIESVPTGLTFTDSTIIGGIISMKISGGTDKTKYRVEVTITTSEGNLYQGDGFLKVADN